MSDVYAVATAFEFLFHDRMLTCPACDGFLPQGCSTCPNCQSATCTAAAEGAPSGSLSRFGRTLKRSAIVACTSVTLAACYGSAMDSDDYDYDVGGGGNTSTGGASPSGGEATDGDAGAGGGGEGGEGGAP